jgi:indoleamine 2,3-dioxygenase
MTLLSCLSHAYVWRGDEPAGHLPERLAIPWYAVAASLGLPPILTYSSYALNNYMRFDPNRAIEMGNLAVVQNFTGGLDEEWFILIHVEIEHRAAPAIAMLHHCLDAADSGDAPLLDHYLATVRASVEAMCASLLKMTEWCDPYVYYQRVRPYLNGWKGHPALASGVIYEGVNAYGGVPQQFRGPTGAQSAIIPALDAMLGIGHQENALCAYLREMRTYMPMPQREFVASIESRGPVRPYVERSGLHSLAELYDACVESVERFRSLHLQFAATYVFRQAQTDTRNPHALGTGGTSFMKHLKQRLDHTALQRIQSVSGAQCPHAR